MSEFEVNPASPCGSVQSTDGSRQTDKPSDCSACLWDSFCKSHALEAPLQNESSQSMNVSRLGGSRAKY